MRKEYLDEGYQINTIVYLHEIGGTKFVLHLVVDKCCLQRYINFCHLNGRIFRKLSLRVMYVMMQTLLCDIGFGEF